MIGGSVTARGQVNAARLLPGRDEIRTALGSAVDLQVSRQPGTARSIGSVIAAAARDSAFRSYAGSISIEGTDRPLAVGTMALVFHSEQAAESTFGQVAAAAHLRTRIGECNVAVETVTAASGLVSYWGYLYRRECLVIMTLDTVDPQKVSMTEFRALMTAEAERIEAAVSPHPPTTSSTSSS